MTGPPREWSNKAREQAHGLLEQHRASMRTKALGHRQQRVLEVLREHERSGGGRATAAVIARAIGYPHTTTDVISSLLGLAVRGLVTEAEPVPATGGQRRPTPTWRLTSAAKAGPQ